VVEGLFTRPGTGATLLDAIWETSRGLRRRGGPRAVLVAVVTDGPEFTNRYSQDIVRELLGSGASLHVIGLAGPSVTRTRFASASSSTTAPRRPADSDCSCRRPALPATMSAASS
jgi:hypothetical protein